MEEVWVGDCVALLRDIPTESVESVVTDPPYGIGFLRAKWDTWKSNRDYAAWVETWAAECLRILKPGGHLLAFSGTKTYHALAWGVEGAGFEIRDMIEWLYVQGMPKMPDIARSKGIDTIPSGLGADLKPAHEPILMARKPLQGTLVQNLEAVGTGAVFADACRIGQDAAGGWKGGLSQWSMSGLDKTAKRTEYERIGRYPANCVTTEDDEWYSAHFNVTSRELSVKIRAEDRDEDAFGRTIPLAAAYSTKYPLRKTGDAGEGTGPQRSVVKSYAKNAHPTSKPTALMQWLIRLVTPPGGLVVDPFCGSGSTLKAAKIGGYSCIGIEKEEEYAHLARLRLGDWEERSVKAYVQRGGTVQTTLF